MKPFLAALTALSLGACATAIRGTTEDVALTSQPSGAAVRLSTGMTCETPCTLKVDRKQEFVASFSKPGYEPQDIPVGTRVAGSGVAASAGNVLLGGVIGVGVDAYTGATLEHFPNPVHATLVPQALPSAQRVKPRPRRIPERGAPAVM